MWINQSLRPNLLIQLTQISRIEITIMKDIDIVERNISPSFYMTVQIQLDNRCSHILEKQPKYSMLTDKKNHSYLNLP